MAGSDASSASSAAVRAPALPRAAGPPAEGPGSGQQPAVAGLLLAAGGGRRLGGRVKALLSSGGRTLVERGAGELRAAGCAPVYVVLGAEAAEVRARAGAGLAGCAVVENPDWPAGMGSSLRAGLAALAAAEGERDTESGGGENAEENALGGTGAGGVAAVLVCLVDQPGVGAAAMARVRRACRSPRTLAAAAYGGRRGHPVLLGAAHWAAVAAEAEGDRGARRYLRAREGEMTLVECGDIADAADVDVPGDLGLLER